MRRRCHDSHQAHAQPCSTQPKIPKSYNHRPTTNTNDVRTKNCSSTDKIWTTYKYQNLIHTRCQGYRPRHVKNNWETTGKNALRYISILFLKKNNEWWRVWQNAWSQCTRANRVQHVWHLLIKKTEILFQNWWRGKHFSHFLSSDAFACYMSAYVASILKRLKCLFYVVNDITFEISELQERENHLNHGIRWWNIYRWNNHPSENRGTILWDECYENVRYIFTDGW